MTPISIQFLNMYFEKDEKNVYAAQFVLANVIVYIKNSYKRISLVNILLLSISNGCLLFFFSGVGKSAFLVTDSYGI